MSTGDIRSNTPRGFCGDAGDYQELQAILSMEAKGLDGVNIDLITPPPSPVASVVNSPPRKAQRSLSRADEERPEERSIAVRRHAVLEPRVVEDHHGPGLAVNVDALV